MMMQTKLFVLVMLTVVSFGCTGTSKPVQKIAKPVDQTAEELVKVREFKTAEGETVAEVSPTNADEGQLKIKF
ncbi:MAG: hypothetical protein HY351_02930 [Candidatus Omnitrophica bacterium]|nr:hypothetical protein [Candidatus Omnitrophota bacterium]